MVITNRHRETGIVLKHGTKLMHCVLMDAAGLTVTKMTEEGFKEWFNLPIELKSAVNKFLEAGERFGITESAKHGLEELLCKQP